VRDQLRLEIHRLALLLEDMEKKEAELQELIQKNRLELSLKCQEYMKDSPLAEYFN
jgi:hypothetical protein